MSQTRILYIHGNMHNAPSTGVHMRILNIGRLLRNFGHVTMVGVGSRINTHSLEVFKAEFDDVRAMKLEIRHYGNNVLGRLRGKIRHHWPNWITHKIGTADQQVIDGLLAEHDVVWFHGLSTADAVRADRLRHSVVDLDDLHHVKYQQFMKSATTWRRRLDQYSLASKWRRKELDSLKRFSAIAVCSEADKELLGGVEKVYVLPNGFDRPGQEPRWQARHQMRLGFIGTLGYEPNQDGLMWFGEKVWPLVRAGLPEAKLRIVGDLPKEHKFADRDGFEALGYVPETADEFATWSAMVVPLRIGGGTRLKILEAFSRKCPVVSTTIGAYGLLAENGRDLILADEPEQFAEQCIRLLQDNQCGGKLAEAGWALFDKQYAWDCMKKRVEGLVTHALEQ